MLFWWLQEQENGSQFSGKGPRTTIKIRFHVQKLLLPHSDDFPVDDFCYRALNVLMSKQITET